MLFKLLQTSKPITVRKSVQWWAAWWSNRTCRRLNCKNTRRKYYIYCFLFSYIICFMFIIKISVNLWKKEIVPLNRGDMDKSASVYECFVLYIVVYICLTAMFIFDSRCIRIDSVLVQVWWEKGEILFYCIIVFLSGLMISCCFVKSFDFSSRRPVLYTTINISLNRNESHFKNRFVFVEYLIIRPKKTTKNLTVSVDLFPG